MEHTQHFIHSTKFKLLLIVLFVLSTITIWASYKVYRSYYISTDDAYINANVVQITPRITGKIVALHVANNQYVTKGQALFDIDTQPFQLAINSATAQLNLNSAELENASHSRDRTISLVAKKYSSQQAGDNALAVYKTTTAKVELAKAALAQANLNMSYTKITAPTSGWVTNLSSNAGDIIQANRPLFALISDAIFWTDANFKETELAVIKAQQTANIVTDLYPGHTFEGVVESISGGTGSVFSLLPPQNATGNWVKVTQRVPVRIRLLHPDPHFPLPIGVSATVTIKLHSRIATQLS